MNRVALFACLGIVAVLAAVASADTVTLTFEGLQTYEPILSYYNGGFGGFGSGPGPSYGVIFGSDSLAIISAAEGGGGNFTNAPSGDTIAFFLSGAGDVMDVPSGFTTGFSFYYSSPFYAGSVTVYSGLDGSGSVLANLFLPTTPNGEPEYPYNYSIWEPIGVSFSGTAESVNFSGVADYIGFDNITLGSQTPTGVPEPCGVVGLIGLGAMGLLGLVWRRRKAA
jgi:hypothetical protein